MDEWSSGSAPKMGSDRSFGLLVGSVLVLFGALSLRGSGRLALGLLAGGALLILAGVLVPSLLGPLNRAWFRFGLLLGRFVAPIVMVLVFVLAIVPSRLLLFVLRKDPLRFRGRSAATFWERRTSPTSFEEQF